ncbi:hypothetical protein GPALN_010385 [Globodera pallida]|nr:hypothetical protein GPALN_010385 [Globodera pallida]
MAEFAMFPKAKYEDMAEKKIRAIGEWKKNGKAAKSFNETRKALEKQSKNIQTEKSSLKHNPLKELKIIPNVVKIWELHKQHDQIREQIDKELNNENYLINGPSTRPMFVYKEWQNWESLHYTREFFEAIEAESSKKAGINYF